MSLNDRIREARKNKGITQEQLGELIGVAKTTIAGYEKNREPTAAKVGEIADVLGVDVNFLFQDEMRQLHNNNATPNEMEGIRKYRLLDERGKKVVASVLDLEYEQYEAALLEKEKQTAAKSVKKADPSYTPVQRHYPEGVIPLDSYHESDEYNDKITLPIYDAGASAGTGVFLDSTNYETAAMPNTHLTQRANFAVWVEGDSMEPRFHNGDLVLVRTQPTVDIGEIGIFVVNGEGFIKKLGENKLVSLNPAYEDIELNEYDEVYCKGKVLGNA